MLSPFQKFFVATALMASAPMAVAQETDEKSSKNPGENPNSDSATMPKGYDESFQTGDIPKPSTPEMDPEASGGDQELNPDQRPENSAFNQTITDFNTGDFLVGATAAFNFPHVVNFGVETLMFQKFGVSLNYGNVTRNINNVDVAMKHTDVRFRWFPWQGSFFAGLALGQHQVSGELNRDIKEPTSKMTVSSHGKLNASANYVIPHFGWFSVWDGGLTMGCDFGYLVPNDPKSTFSATFANPPEGTDGALRETNEFKKMKKDLEDSAKSYASKRLPFATFLRLGWMF